LEPESLADTSRDQVRRADERPGMTPESIAQAADRLRNEAWIAGVREAAQPPEAAPPIAAATPGVGARSTPRVAFSTARVTGELQ
jgi:hypothetical protein